MVVSITAAVTSTVCCVPAGESLMSTRAVSVVSSFTSGDVTGLNPSYSAVTVYRIGGSDGIVKYPSADVTVTRFTPVSTAVIVTFAPGIAAPVVSITCPVKVDVLCPCAGRPQISNSAIRTR